MSLCYVRLVERGFPVVGEVFGNDFEIVRPLSEGGMGAVYIARQRSTGRERALKLMHPELLADAKLRQRFEQEARIGSRVASDHVVEVIAAGVDEARGIPWLAMELLQGETLAAMVERLGPRPVAEVLDVFEQLCHALAAAHAQRIVHRDLKPENVFLAESRRVGARYLVKVLDFGIAKVVAEAQTKATAAIGTPWWMAPEQSSPGAETTPAADVWALGLIAFYLLTGRSYWRSATSDEPSPIMALREIVLEPLEPASQRATSLGHGPGLPPGFDAWFDRCVARDPSARFRDAGELFAALRATLGGAAPSATGTLAAPPLASALQAAVTPAGFSGRRYVGPGGVGGADPTMPARGAAPPAKSRAALFAGIGAIAVVGAGVAFALRGSSSSAPGAAAESAAALAPAASAAATPVASTPAPSAAPQRDQLLTWLAERNEASVSRSETIRGAGGVFAGLPAGWVTQDLNDRMAVEPFDCLVFHIAVMSGATTCFVTRDTLPEIAGKNGLDDYGSRLSWKDIQWSKWEDAAIGPRPLKAKLIRGKGETIGAKGHPREGFAALIEIPGKRHVFGIGSWRNEEQRRATLEIFRGVDVAGAPAPAAEACAKCATQEDFDAALRKKSRCCPVTACARDADCFGRVCCRIPDGQLCADAKRCAAADRVSR